MKTIIIFGLIRSGNHFIISTILQQYSNYVHMNCITLSYDKYIKYSNIEKDKDRIDGEWCGFKGTSCVVLSMENKIIDFNVLEKFNKLNDCYTIILLRCPYSHLSSVWKVCNQREDILIKIIKLWKIYAKYFVGDNKLIKALYDEYASNNSYIINTLKKLGIYANEIKRNEKIKWQESSFTKNSEKKRTYDTLEGCLFKNDKMFVRLVEDEEITNLWKFITKGTLTN